jgi:mRNA interferase HicA
MPKLPSITPRKIISALVRIGFKVDHVTGSHYILFNVSNGKRATIPFHARDLPKGTLHSILKSSGLSEKDL